MHLRRVKMRSYSLNLLSWDDIKFFTIVANTPNLSAAAESLKVNQTTVSRRILKLEEHYQAPLFKRVGKDYILTNKGEGLLEIVNSLGAKFEMIHNFLADKKNELYGNILLTTTHSIHNLLLAPALAGFYKKYPNFKIDLDISEEFFNLYRREADAAIRVTKEIEPFAKGTKIDHVKFALYATKKYMNGSRQASEAFFFEENNFITYNKKLSHLKSAKWLSEKVPANNVILKVSSILAAYSAVKGDVGIAMLPSFIGRSDKSLLELTKLDKSLGVPVWIVAKKEIFDTEKIAIFTNYFNKVLSKSF